MRLAAISFTRAGSLICERLVDGFCGLGISCEGYVQKKFIPEVGPRPGISVLEESAGGWTGRMFDQVDGLLYIGAAGIAVRAIAPFVKDKLTDPAVVVIDEQGRHAISLLSGHVGGANHLARMAADLLGAEPVITTASDVQGRTAVDVWAARRDLKLSDRELAKAVAAALVDGEPVGFFSDYRLAASAPADFACGQVCRMNVWVTCRKGLGRTLVSAGAIAGGVSAAGAIGGSGADVASPGSDIGAVPAFPGDALVLRLIPACLTVGIGCRRDTAAGVVADAIRNAFAEHGLDLRAAARLASISLKEDERGIIETAKSMGIPFVTFSGEQLNGVQGDFGESEFVRKVTGVGNVCERAALLGAGPGSQILVHKEICGGVTVAVAVADLEIR